MKRLISTYSIPFAFSATASAIRATLRFVLDKAARPNQNCQLLVYILRGLAFFELLLPTYITFISQSGEVVDRMSS
jgi:hypothetical protein